MTLTTTALALYHRTKAQYHLLTRPIAASADHNHPRCALTIGFPVHRTRGPRRRRPRPLTSFIHHLLAAFPPAPLPPARPAPPVMEKPPCRLCAATSHAVVPPTLPVDRSSP